MGWEGGGGWGGGGRGQVWKTWDRTHDRVFPGPRVDIHTELSESLASNVVYKQKPRHNTYNDSIENKDD